MRPPGFLLALLLGACASTEAARPTGTVRYEGSSTVAIFLRAAEAEYGAIDFDIDTHSESDGGEQAIAAGRVDLAGIARLPRSETLLSGVAAELIGRDAIAVIVNAKNPVTNLSSSALQQIFTGQATSWQEFGGPDLPVEPFIVGPGSATRDIFAASMLDGQEFAGCEEVQPDEAILERVSSTPGGVAHISFSFLEATRGVRAVAIDAEEPDVTNFDYPISRPLYLLWREGDPVVDAFVAWTETSQGQGVVMRNFVGARVVGSVRGTDAHVAFGTLVVITETFPFDDGGIFYYPHRPYQILDRSGVLVRRVQNHRGENDERPMRIELRPDTYLIRVRSERGEVSEFFVTVEPGKVTRLDVAQLLKKRG